jgi:hypothetical protein
MNNICKYCLSTTTCCDDIETENCSNYIEFQKEPKQEKERGLIIKKSDGSIMMKQETLEEVVKNIFNSGDSSQNGKVLESGLEVLLQQNNRMYSEEEVEVIAKDAYAMGRNNILIGVFNKWFEQVKKK